MTLKTKVLSFLLKINITTVSYTLFRHKFGLISKLPNLAKQLSSLVFI